MPKNKGTKHSEKEIDKSMCLAVTPILSKVKSVVRALNAVWNHVVFMFEDEMPDWFARYGKTFSLLIYYFASKAVKVALVAPSDDDFRLAASGN